MPYVPPGLLLTAAEALSGAHALVAVTLPALLREGVRAGVDVSATQVPYGAAAETELLTEFFRLPRPPETARPFRAIWAVEPPWQTTKFPGGGLQRQRTHAAARGEVLIQRKPADTGLPGDVWSLTPHAGAELTERSHPVRLIDLALWMGREKDTDTIDPAVLAHLPATAEPIDKLDAWFKAEFQPHRGDLVGTILIDDIPPDYRTQPFAADTVGEATYELLGSLPPSPVVQDDFATIVHNLEGRLVADGYQLPTGLIRRVLTAWLRGDLVILVGQPGTGKSLFASLLGHAMEVEFDLSATITISVRADFDEAEFIGYERLDGTPHLQDFAREILKSDSPLEARVVILEEFNLAAAETYMGSVLVATQERDRQVRLPSGDLSQLPVDTFIIATCNSFRDEPETRTRVSSPTKRRSTTITMPNVLGDRFESDPEDAVLGVVESLVANERLRVQQRVDAGRAAQFDSVRLSGLTTVAALGDLSTAVCDTLKSIANAILGTASGRSWFTLGLLRDVVLEVVHAERNEEAEMRALGQAVADKLVHQLRGTHADVQDLRAATVPLPNASEIERLIEQVMSGPADELIPLL